MNVVGTTVVPQVSVCEDGEMKIVNAVCVAAVLLAVSGASADVFRFMGNGNWEDSQWQNQTQGLDNVAPPGSGDIARMNWGGGTCTFS